LVGGFWAAFTFFVAWFKNKTNPGSFYLLALGILSIFFAILAGLVVPKAGFWPASWLNQDTFFNTIGVPVHVPLILIAGFMTMSVWFILQKDGIRNKLVYALIFTISTFSILGGGGWLVNKTGNSRLNAESEQILIAARLSAASINSELISGLKGLPSDIGTPQYVELKERLMKMKSAYPGFRFIYLVHLHNDSIIFLADSEPATSDDYSAPGDFFTGAPDDLSKVIIGKWKQLSVVYNDAWGEWLSAFVPVYSNKTGELVAVLGIDRSLELITRNVSTDRIKIIFIVFLIMALLIFFYVHNEIRKDAFEQISSSENEIRASEEKLRSLINHLYAGVLVHDPETRIILCNAKASNLLGMPVEQLQGKPADDPTWHFLRDDGTPLPLNEFPVNQVIADHQPLQNYILGVVQPESSKRIWILVNAFPEFFANHKIRQIVVTFTDITELKQAEEALIESETLNRLVIENQGEGIGIVDLNECFTFANPAADQMFGLERGGLVGKNLMDFITPNYFNVINSETQKRAKSVKSSYEIEIITKSGEAKSLLITATPKYDNKGSHSGTFGVFRDITDRKLAEKALRESEERYKAAFSTLPEAISITNAEGIIIDVNEGFVTLSGFAKNEIIGATVGTLNIWTNPNDRSIITETVRQQGLIENFETVFRNKSGSFLTALVSACLINFNNQPHILSITRDITGRKQIENDLIKAKENAEESDRLKSAFLANMSHEIRTPMNIILGLIPNLDEENLDASERKNLIQIISRKGTDLITIINDIIDISMIDSHQLTITNTTFNLNELLDAMLLSFENEKIINEKTNIKISNQKSLTGAYSNIITDQVRLSQILNNLIGNALKFTSVGHIKFGYHIEKENLLFFVEDTGKGIAKEKHAIIWERFRQEEESNARTFGGVGLGLSISKELVGLLGGSLWFTSQEENPAEGKSGGSTFYFTLPISVLVKQEIVSARPVEERISYDFSGKTILIAEDVEDNFEVLRLILRKFNPVLIYAENGEVALGICKTNPEINLILMDVRMPVMDGYKATIEIRKFNPEIPIIALTAHAFMEDKARSIAAGCNNFITKPIDQKKLLKMIDHYLGME
jgi:PAS domain S-box-containing protein